MRKRLREFAAAHSQSDIARRTNTPRSTVNRYLAGTKIPAEFCCALVPAFGVNPVWLLTGEGTPKLSDVTASAAGTASNLLEMVEAMNAVQKMRLGSLMGQERQRVLHTLNESLTTYERLRVSLNEHTRPLFEQLLDDLENSIWKIDMAAAEQIERAAAQVARLCDDEQLQARLTGYRASIAYYAGATQRAVELRERLFAGNFRLNDEPANKDLIEGCNLIVALGKNGRNDVALRVARALLALFSNASHLENYQYAVFLEGIQLMTCGNLEAGLHSIVHGYSRMTPALQDSHRALVNLALMLSAAATVHDIAGADREAFPAMSPYGQANSAIMTLRFACLTEDIKALAAARQVYEQAPRMQRNLPGDYIREYAAGLDAHGRGDLGPLKTSIHGSFPAMLEGKSRVDWFELIALCARGHLHLEELDEARRLTLECANLERHRGRRIFSPFRAAFHYRNILDLFAPAPDRPQTAPPRPSRTARASTIQAPGITNAEAVRLVEGARRFFDDHYARGFQAFAPWTSPGAKSPGRTHVETSNLSFDARSVSEL